MSTPWLSLSPFTFSWIGTPFLSMAQVFGAEEGRKRLLRARIILFAPDASLPPAIVGISLPSFVLVTLFLFCERFTSTDNPQSAGVYNVGAQGRSPILCSVLLPHYQDQPGPEPIPAPTPADGGNCTSAKRSEVVLT